MVVFVPASNEAHALNQTASLIFDLCDGVTTRAQMVAALRDVGLPADTAIVNLALAELAEAQLLVADDERPQLGVSRRTVIRRLGLSATAIALLPVVDTILVQPAAAQTSNTTTTTSTTTSHDVHDDLVGRGARSPVARAPPRAAREDRGRTPRDPGPERAGLA